MSTVRVPSKDYSKQYAALGDELQREIRRVMFEENPILGPSVSKFERAFADYHGAESCVGVGSGTDALILALRCLEVGPGDEVITASNTFAATVTAILTVGARPVLVEPDPATWTIDVNAVRAAIGPKTTAVIPVHLYGRLCAMEELVPLCEAHNLGLVEDCAQAHGAFDGRRAGTFGVFGCFSFHPSKNLGAFGDGGAILCRDPEAAERLKELRNLGKRGKHEFVHVATNSKLDTLQAAILNVKLRHLDAGNAKRREHAKVYADALRGLDGIELPSLPKAEEHVFHLFAVHSDERDALRTHLAGQGVRAGLHYPVPPHLQPMCQPLNHQRGDFPLAEASASRQLSLPISPELEADQIRAACVSIHEYFAR